MKKGFTLVELLAVIVILAIILVIAVPQINNVIKQTKINSLASTGKMIAAKAEEKEVENDVLGITTTVTCSDLVKLDSNYDSENCTVEKNTTTGKWEVTLSGTTGGKFAGFTCTGTKSDMNCTEGNSDNNDNEQNNNNNNTASAATIISNKYNGGTNDEGLILVNANEYRYSGATVKNYVNFNNETWRIVGIFNGRIKLMRDAVIRSAKWDSTTPYSNVWEGSEIEVGLNGNYLTSTGYLGSSLNSAAQNLIEDATWYVTPITYAQNTVDAYAEERPITGATIYEGKVGLIYPSDYGYASSSCYNDSTKLLYDSIQADSYHSDTCNNTNWMYENMSSTCWWTISPYLYSSNFVLEVFDDNLVGVDGGGGVDGKNVRDANGVRPSVYLKSGVKLASTSGDGSSAANAYVFEL